jgi:hypothetical protein
MLISTALLLDSIIRNSVCTLAKLPCRRVEVGYEKIIITSFLFKIICSHYSIVPTVVFYFSLLLRQNVLTKLFMNSFNYIVYCSS